MSQVRVVAERQMDVLERHGGRRSFERLRRIHNRNGGNT